MQFEDNEEFKQIITEFANELPARIHLISMLWSNYKLHMTRDSLEAFVNEVHKIAGTAGMVGFDELGNTAKDLQNIVRTTMNGYQLEIYEIESINELVSKMNAESASLSKITKDTP